jgi:TldD protein
VRIGRYLNQFVVTRDKNIENIVDTESTAWVSALLPTAAGVLPLQISWITTALPAAAENAVAIAKENARIQTDPVQLAPQKGYGEVSWKTPIERNAFEVPMKEKTDLLLSVNDAAFKNGANYVNSVSCFCERAKILCINRWFIYRPGYPPHMAGFGITKIDDKTGKFETRSH